MPASATPPPRVLLACSGLDHAWRGFESFARDCFEELRDDPEVDIELVKGSGSSAFKERSVRGLTRDSVPVRAAARLSGKRAFVFEHLLFALSLQPAIFRSDPDVIYFSEWHTGLALAKLRHLTRRRYRLLLSNGTMSVSGFGHLDHVQQLTPAALDIALELGADPGTQTMLPLPTRIDRHFEPIATDDRAALRSRLGLPVDRPVILSVAALNRSHKRLDYLIDEVARLPEPRPFLLMAGQPEEETAGLRSFARERLTERGHEFRTVPYSDVPDLYRASDAHVLASLGEALGRVLIEALAYGVPCLAHDYPVTRFVLGDQGRLADFSQPGALAALLRETVTASGSDDDARARHEYAYENFSWDRLRPRYVELFRAANSTVSSSSGEAVLR
jgi:glycosyltransferase involved in cell wall biosynthesis